MVDRGFLLAKLRVVKDNNELYSLAVDLARGKIPEENKLKELLQISGESLKPVDRKIFWNALRWILPLYLITPFVATVLCLFSIF